MTFEEFKSTFSNSIGDLCIVHDLELVRFKGFTEDERDYYYIVQPLGAPEYWATAVGSIYTLKGVLPPENYARMDKLFKLNNA